MHTNKMIFIASTLMFFAGVHIAGAQPTGDTLTQPWEGEVTGSNVYVRSGAGTHYYPTTKLNVGDRVLVLGEKFGWYRISPPTDSFSYVDMALVEIKAGSRIGTVMQDRVYVRAGSQLVSRKSATQAILNKGMSVHILGQADGFYKIQPPRSATLFISKQYVKRVADPLRTGLVKRYLASTKRKDSSNAASSKREARRLNPNVSHTGTSVADRQTPSAQRSVFTNAKRSLPSQHAAGTKSLDNSLPEASPIHIAPTIQAMTPSSKQPDRVAAKDRPTPGGSAKTPRDIPAAPMRAHKGRRYSALLSAMESDLIAMMQRPAEERDLEAMINGFEEIADQNEDQIASRYAKIRIDQLRSMIRIRKVQADYLGGSEDLEAFRVRMDQERMKLMRARAEAVLEKYDLEGELRKSYAFAPEKRRYRLVDPQRQTTLAYVDVPRSIFENAEHMIGRLVGIRVSSKRYSPAARIPIAVAADIVDLTSRPSGQGVINPLESVNPQNTPTEIANSSEETQQRTDRSTESEKTTVAKGEDEQEDPDR